MDKNELLELIYSRIADYVEALSDEELCKLADHQYGIEVRAIKRRVQPNSENKVLDFLVEEEIVLLTNFASREEAKLFLTERHEKRKNLETISRFLDIPIAKKDRIDVIINKIVDLTVGSRLRSEAIQGKNQSEQ